MHQSWRSNFNNNKGVLIATTMLRNGLMWLFSQQQQPQQTQQAGQKCIFAKLQILSQSAPLPSQTI